MNSTRSDKTKDNEFLVGNLGVHKPLSRFNIKPTRLVFVMSSEWRKLSKFHLD